MAKVSLCGDKIRVEVELAEGRLHESYLAQTDDGAWVEVARAGEDGPVNVYGTQPYCDGGLMPVQFPVQAEKVSVAGKDMIELFTAGPLRLSRKITVDADSPWLRVTTRLETTEPVELQAFADRFVFPHSPEWAYSPSVGGYNPDAQYKAPLILVQSKRTAFGIVPDVAALDRGTLGICTHALDLSASENPSLCVGFLPAQWAYHAVYSLDTRRAWKLDKSLENSYFLLVTASAEPERAYRQCVRFHWKRFGRLSQSVAAAQQMGTGPYEQLALFDDWRRRAWQEESRDTWVHIPLPDGSIGGAPATKRAMGPRSVYMGSWFNSLRTSFGMALHARRTGDDELLRLAAQTAELALAAPGVDGAFKCIAAMDADGKPQWGAGDGRGGSTIAGFLSYDMSWTAYWLLRWREAKLPGHEKVLPRCQALARFLISHQQADGMFMTFFDEAGKPLVDKAPYAIAETGPVILFLFKLCEAEANTGYLAAAMRGLAYLENEVIPPRKWYDFETFWSCSPRGIKFDERTRQWPANNLALGQAVAAYLEAFQLTKERDYLGKGEDLLDYLLLTQQCWTNPMLEGLTGPVMLLGGFTTQNSDAEWSDARQSQHGNILLDYYRATGKAEYLERGVAALRAQFPVSPSENWAHHGYGGKAGVSSFHWGTGSGMAGIEMEQEFLRDVVVDLAAGVGVGVDGLNVTRCAVGAERIELDIDSPFAWRRNPVVAFHYAEPGKSYALAVNGVELGRYTGRDLAGCVPLDASLIKERQPSTR